MYNELVYTCSKALSSLVLIGALAFKVPQIMKISKNKSADGVAIEQVEIFKKKNLLPIKHTI